METPEAETFEALQGLEQGRMQRLGDRLLARVFPELAALRPHGISDEGKTRKGVPDSFVGSSAKLCTVAVEYTTQADRLRAKFERDYSGIRARCPGATRIVLCTNRDCGELDLEPLSKRAAGDQVELRIVDGRALASFLCGDCQDLREAFLDLPMTLFTFRSLLPTIQRRLDSLLDECGNADQFLSRPQLDRALMDRGVTRKPGVSVVVGALGQGKTTWSKLWARSLSATHPVAWVSAGLVEWGRPGALTDAILRSIFGHGGESVLVRLGQLCSSSGVCVVVVVDGIDEVSDVPAVRRSLEAFRHDLLGSKCHLVLTCRSGYDEHFFSRGANLDNREPLSVYRIPVPDFTRAERESFFARLGCSPHEQREVCRYLPESRRGNPLQLQLGFRLLASAGTTPRPDEWEVEIAKRLHDELQQILMRRGFDYRDSVLEQCFAELGLLVLEQGPAVDELTLELLPLCSQITERLPPVVVAAISAEILERRRGRISFRHAFLCEYWAARAVLLRSRTEEPLNVLEGLPRRAAIIRYASMLSMEFARAVAANDEALVVAVALPLPTNCEALEDLEKRAVGALASPYRTTVTRALSVLARIGGLSSISTVVQWMAAKNASEFAEELAEFFFEVEDVGRARLVLLHQKFSMAASFGLFEPEHTKRLGRCSAEFLRAIADEAHKILIDPTSDRRLWRLGVVVLAYLGDDRLVELLSSVVAERCLDGAENAALILLNTDASIAVYQRSCERHFAKIEAVEGIDGELDAELSYETMGLISNVRLFPHDVMTRFVDELLLSSRSAEVDIGATWARQLREPQLLPSYAKGAGKQWSSSTKDIVTAAVSLLSFGEALDLYRSLPQSDTRRQLLLCLAATRRDEVQEEIFAALDTEDERYAAIAAIACHGAQDTAQVLCERFPSFSQRDQQRAAKTLGQLRYAPAAEILTTTLQALLAQPVVGDNRVARDLEYNIIVALGSIGRASVWDLFARTYRSGRFRKVCLALLLRANEPATLNLVKELVAEEPETAPRLIVDALATRHVYSGADSFGPYEARKQEYSDPELFALVRVETQRMLESAPSSEMQFSPDFHHAVDCLASFELEAARLLLREVASKRDAEQKVLRDAALQATEILADRGDPEFQEILIELMLSRIGERDDLHVSGHEVDELRKYPSPLVQRGIAERMHKGAKPLAAWVWLAIQLGLECDRDMLGRLRDHEDETVADLANEYLVGARPQLVR